MDRSVAQQAVMETVLNHIKSTIPKNASVPTNEGENISRIIALFISPTKDANPREIMRSLSDPIIEHLVSNHNNMPDHPMMKMIFQLFLIEWCYRNDYLLEDWVWRWEDDGKNGSADVNPRIPFADIPLPKAT